MKRWYIWLFGLRPGDKVAIVLGIMVIAGCVAAAISGYWAWQKGVALHPNFGFGPDWHCTWVAKGEPVCFKETDPATH